MAIGDWIQIQTQTFDSDEFSEFFDYTLAPWDPLDFSIPGLTTPSHADLLRISFVKHWDSVPRMSGRGKTWEPVGCWMLKVKVDEGCSTVEVKHRRNHSFFSMVGSWELVCAVVLVKLRPGVDLES